MVKHMLEWLAAVLLFFVCRLCLGCAKCICGVSSVALRPSQVSITWWCLYKNCCLAWVQNHVVTFTGGTLEEEGQLSCLLGYFTWCLIEHVDRH